MDERGDSMVIGIIGGGASGMAAALAAAENKENKIIIFERQARVGRKLLATGNGRCNLTNLQANGDCYHGDHPDFAKHALNRYSVKDTLNWFGSMGLYTVTEESGRVYPYSDQANSVVDVLRFALQKSNIQLLTGYEVNRIRKNGDGFSVEAGEEVFLCNKVIVACGGLAGTKLGGSMAGYKLLRNLGHHCTRLRPVLVQLKSDWFGCEALKGVRANCKVSLDHDRDTVAASTGEVQFTQYGLSGPVIFEISRDACIDSGKWTCVFDFLPELSMEQLNDMLKEKQKTNLTVEDLFTGILHNRLGRVIVSGMQLAGNRLISSLSDYEITLLCACAKGLVVPVTEPMGMDSAQVTAGGIFTEEFDPNTMESRLVTGLYACGEVLDIDGDCGGYNLQWAWSSGRLAGSAAGGVK